MPVTPATRPRPSSTTPSPSSSSASHGLHNPLHPPRDRRIQRAPGEAIQHHYSLQSRAVANTIERVCAEQRRGGAGITSPDEQDADGDGCVRISGSRQRLLAANTAVEEQEGGSDNTPAPAWMQSSSSQRGQQQSWLRAKIVSIYRTVVNFLRTPASSIPLVIKLTETIWFYLLVGKHGMLYWFARSCGHCGV